MRPATSGRTVIDSSERRLPTAVMVCGIACWPTLDASTVTVPCAAPLPGAPPTLALPDDWEPDADVLEAISPPLRAPYQ